MPENNMQRLERYGASESRNTDISAFVEEIKKANNTITQELERIQSFEVTRGRVETPSKREREELEIARTQEERLSTLAETTTRSFMENYYRGTILDRELTRSIQIQTGFHDLPPLHRIPKTEEARVTLKNNVQWVSKHLTPWLAGEDQVNAEQRLEAHEVEMRKITYSRHSTNETSLVIDLPGSLCVLRVQSHHHFVERVLSWAKHPKPEYRKAALQNWKKAHDEAMEALKTSLNLKFVPLIAKCHYWLGSIARMQGQSVESTYQGREEAAKAFLYAFPCINYYDEGDFLEGPIKEFGSIMQSLAENEKWLPKTQTNDFWSLYLRIKSGEERWPGHWDDYLTYEAPQNLSGQLHLQGNLHESQTPSFDTFSSEKSTPTQAKGRKTPPPLTSKFIHGRLTICKSLTKR